MRVEDFDFELPEELIAQTPLLDRTASKLMVVDPIAHTVAHHQFANIVDELQAGDCLVLNDTRVLPARLMGVKEETGAHIELLLLKQTGETDEWETLVKPAKRVKIGTVVTFGEGLLSATCIGELDHGGRMFRFSYDGIFYEILDQLGEMPLPPYIREKLDDQDRYQTVYAKERGSAAAPTAGLHFTDALLDDIRAKGVSITFITLHVGLGTFRPVSVESIEDHEMHSEFYSVSSEVADMINRTKANGGKVIAVGTTSTYIRNNCVKYNGQIRAEQGWTSILFTGYTFRCIDGLITNFHLPKSHLLCFVSALAGQPLILLPINKQSSSNIVSLALAMRCLFGLDVDHCE